MVQDLYQRSLSNISVRGLLARSQPISMQCLYTRPPKEVSWQDRIFVQDLYTRSLDKTLEQISLKEISTEDLSEGSQSKVSVQAP